MQLTFKSALPKDKWETPPEVFAALNSEFGFTLDPCCEAHTAKCEKFYTEEQDGLAQDWTGEVVFVNPPYSHGNIGRWMRKCYAESQKGATVVALIPAATSSRWFHASVYGKAEIRFCDRRLKFVGGTGPAPFHSIIAVYAAPRAGAQGIVATGAAGSAGPERSAVANSPVAVPSDAPNANDPSTEQDPTAR